MENKNKCAPNPLTNKSSILKTLGGADLRGDNMQGRPEGAGGEPCSVIESKIPLPKRVEKCGPCTTTASKYNGGSFDKTPYIYGLDYLLLNCTGTLPIAEDEEEYQAGDWKFIHQGSGTKHFKALFDVYYKSDLFGVIEAYPRSTKVIDEKTIRLKVDNQLFYIGDDILKERVFAFFGELDINFRNITRLDVYFDSYGFANGMTLNDLDYLLAKGEILSNTRVKESNKFNIKHDGKFIASGFSWGSRSSYRYLRIYNKTAEATKRGKNYILDHHKRNGLTEKDVYRFEYELKNDFFKYNPNFDFTHIFSKEGQFEMLHLAAKGHFSFVKEDGKKRNDRKETIELINWNEMREQPEFIYDYQIKKKISKAHSKKRIQLVIRGLIECYLNTDQVSYFIYAAIWLVKKYNLKEWFEKNEERYIKEFTSKRSFLYEFNEPAYKYDRWRAERLIPIEL